MRMLFDAGADPRLTLKDRTTVAMIAAAGGAVVGAYAVAIPVTEESSLEALKLCVEHGVDINAFNTNGWTALHNAVARGAKIVTYLAEQGAKLDMKDKQGRTPLDVALGVGGAAGRRGGGGGGGRGGGGRGNEATAALLRELLAKNGTPARRCHRAAVEDHDAGTTQRHATVQSRRHLIVHKAGILSRVLAFAL